MNGTIVFSAVVNPATATGGQMTIESDLGALAAIDLSGDFYAAVGATTDPSTVQRVYGQEVELMLVFNTQTRAFDYYIDGSMQNDEPIAVAGTSLPKFVGFISGVGTDGNEMQIDDIRVCNLPVCTFNTPAAVADVNGLTATVTFDRASPQAEDTSITATVTLTGTATAAGTHTVGFTSAGCVEVIHAPADVTKVVTANQAMAATDVFVYMFNMPASNVDDFSLTHVFEPAHTHHFGTQWERDALSHWHTCACGDNADLASHVAGPAATATTAQVCTVCGYELAPATGVRYAVTVNGSGAATTGAGDYTQGETVYIHAGITTGYVFDGWTASGVTFADTNLADTSFEMPGAPVTVTANWAFISSDIRDLTVQGGANNLAVEAALDGGTAIVITEGPFLGNMLAMPGTVGNITIDANLGADIHTAGLSVASINEIEAAANNDNSGVTGMETKLDTGTVQLDAAALTAVKEQADGNLAYIHVEKISQDSLSATQLAAMTGAHAGDTVLEVTIISNGVAITNFNGGKITVTVPYTLKAGENAAGIRVWHLAENGTLTLVECTYNAEAKTVSFVTDHLSDYVVGFEGARVPPNTGVHSPLYR